MYCDDEATFWRAAGLAKDGAMKTRLIFFSGWLIVIGVGVVYGLYCRWFNWMGMVWGWALWLTFEGFTDALAKWLVARERER